MNDSDNTLPIEDRRNADRRYEHNPVTCTQLHEVQQAVNSIKIDMSAYSHNMYVLEKRIDNIFHSLTTGSEATVRLEEKLNTNNAATAELLEIITSGKGFFKTVGLLGTVLRWGLGIATAIVAFVFALKTGKG